MDDKIESLVNGWNQYFEFRRGLANSFPEPWRSYSGQSVDRLRTALLEFLAGDREAFERFESWVAKARMQIRESQDLLRKALGTPNDLPEVVRKEESPEAAHGMSCVILSGIDDPGQARSFMDGLIGLPILGCSRCGRLFLKKGKRRKFCSEECQKKTAQPNDRTESRRAYRRIFMRFERLKDKGLSAPSAVESLLEDSEIQKLVTKFGINVEKWKGG